MNRSVQRTSTEGRVGGGGEFIYFRGKKRSQIKGWVGLPGPLARPRRPHSSWSTTNTTLTMMMMMTMMIIVLRTSSASDRGRKKTPPPTPPPTSLPTPQPCTVP